MKRLALAVLLVLVSACSTYPPPKIEKGCYQNYEYGFVLNLPGSDWELLEGTRRHLRKSFPLESRRNILLVLYNKETSGQIVLMAKKNLYPPTEIKFKIFLLETMWPIEAKKDPKVTSAGSCGQYSYPEGHDACVYVDYDSEDGVSSITSILFARFFPIGKHVHRIDVFFIFNQGTYGENYPAFVELVRSLQHGDECTVSELTMEREKKRPERQRLEPQKEQLAYIPESVTHPRIQLRKQPRELSSADVESIFLKYNFYNKKSNPRGSFANSFKYNGDWTVTDVATGLMWQQYCSQERVTWDEATEYVQTLNRNHFAGFSDWRLPTIEELASLIEPQRWYGGFIDPIFWCPAVSKCWSADSYRMYSVWCGDFARGLLSVLPNNHDASVKAVRSMH